MSGKSRRVSSPGVTIGSAAMSSYVYGESPLGYTRHWATHDDATRCDAWTGERALDNDGLGTVGGAHRDPELEEGLPAVLDERGPGEEGRARLPRDVHVLRRRVKRRRREVQHLLIALDRPHRGAGVRGRRRRAGVLRWADLAAEGGREQLGGEAKADDGGCSTSFA